MLKQSQATTNDAEESKEGDLVRADTILDQVRRQFSVYFSCVQIYNDTMSDLLSKSETQSLKLRQNNMGQFFVETTQKLVTSPE